MKNSKGLFLILLTLAIHITNGCGSSKPYNAKYEAAWEDVVRSEAWKQSLRSTASTDYHEEASIGTDGWLTTENTTTLNKDPFYKYYDSWISRAYFKIIAEAQEADSRIKAEYERFKAENPEAASSTDENVIRILAMYKKKYQAHDTMLSGLRSWNAFEEYGSDDLKFFKADYEDVIRAMYRRGVPEKNLIDFLVYKLADLYHLDTASPEQ